jgi:hypothetical protein
MSCVKHRAIPVINGMAIQAFLSRNDVEWKIDDPMKLTKCVACFPYLEPDRVAALNLFCAK